MTDAGTVATEGFDEARFTIAPPDGASPLSVAVPVEVSPAITDAGFRDNVERTGASTLNCAVRVTPAYEAVMVDVESVVTTLVEIEKVADCEPARTTTDDGTEAAETFELLSATVKPPAGAEPLKLTVPVTIAPPYTVDGLNDSAVRFVA